MKKTQIFRIYLLNGVRVGETADKQEINYYRKQGASIVATGSYVVRRG